MAGWDLSASVTALAFRATRLDITGAPIIGANNQIVFGGGSFDRVQHTREYETGNDVSATGASGAVCVAYKVPDSIKRNNITLALCSVHPEAEELLCGGADLTVTAGTASTLSAATTAGQSTFTAPVSEPAGAYTIGSGAALETVTVVSSVGTASPFTMTIAGTFANAHASGDPITPVPASNGYAAPQTFSLLNQGVALEVWTLAVKNAGPAPTQPYFRWLYPRVYGFRRTGDTVLNNGITAAVFEGYGVGNAGLAAVGLNPGATAPVGPTKDWVSAGFPVDRVDAYVRTSTLPTITNGYATVAN